MVNKKVAEAYARCKPARDALVEAGAVCMEVTEDKAGILWERWYIATRDNRVVNIVVFATPSGWDVFTPIDPSNEVQATIDAIKALAG